MMKIITYAIAAQVNRGTEEAPDLVQVLTKKEIHTTEGTFASNYAMAQKEACGEIAVKEVPDPETEPTQAEDAAAMLVDHEYRLTMLELGLFE